MNHFKSAVLLSVIFASASSMASSGYAQTPEVPNVLNMTVAQYDMMNMDVLYNQAVQGSNDAQFHLARRLQKGIGVRKDLATAAQWYAIAGENGVTDAQLNLGFMYTSGEGVTANEYQARYWLGKAAMSGENHASYILAMLDEKQHKLVDAYKWYDVVSRDGKLPDQVKNKARGKIGQLAMNLSYQDINNARSLANSWVINH